MSDAKGSLSKLRATLSLDYRAFRTVNHEKGVFYIIRTSFLQALNLLLSIMPRYFYVGETKLRYLNVVKKYLSFFYKLEIANNERVIEIPFAHEFYLRNISGSVLEVGNVLRNYFPLEHYVLDKYELGEDVVNDDVATWKANRKYSLIISISTIEHIGFDEPEKEKGKSVKAINNLISMLQLTERC